LRRSKRFQCGHFLVGLHNADKDIQVKGDHRADNVGPAPATHEVTTIAGENGNGQHDQRYDADCVSRGEVMEWKAESGHTRGYSGNQRKSLVQPWMRFPLNSPIKTTKPEKIPIKLIRTCTIV